MIGQPLLVAMPEIGNQDVYNDLVHVYETGEIFEAKQRPVYLNTNNGQKKVYVNFTFKAIRDNSNTITGVLGVAYDVTDEVMVNQRLERAETTARVAIESVGLGTFEKDLETGEIITSRRFNEIFGFTEQQSHEDYIHKIHPEDRALRDVEYAKGLQSGKFSYEVRIFRTASDERWIKVYGTCLYDEMRQPIRLISTVFDITDEKLATLNLKESEERFRTLITETPEVGSALYTGPEIRIQYVNPVMLKFWDKDESVIGKTIREALPELEGQPFFDLFDYVFATGVSYIGKGEKAILERDGKQETRYFDFTYKPLRNSKGEVYEIHHMAVDVTEQVKVKHALIESEESVRRLFEQTPVGIAALNGPSLIIERVNEAMLQFWNRERSEVINRSLWRALPEIRNQESGNTANSRRSFAHRRSIQVPGNTHHCKKKWAGGKNHGPLCISTYARLGRQRYRASRNSARCNYPCGGKKER